MGKINVKKSILEIVEKNNLEILKIDLVNSDEAFARRYNEDRNIFSCKVYITLEDLDFEVDSVFWHDDGRVGQLSRIVPYRSPSERFMCATLSLTLFFHMEKKDGIYDNREVYVHGFPIKL